MSKRNRTIQQAEKRQTLLMQRLRRTVTELSELETWLKKARTGRIKIAFPPGVRVKIESNRPGLTADEFGDLIPSFGPQ